MNSFLNKIVVVVINDQCIKREKDMVMGYANTLFVKLMDWLYVSHVQMTPGDMMKNQDAMLATYNVEEPIEIMFD